MIVKKLIIVIIILISIEAKAKTKKFENKVTPEYIATSSCIITNSKGEVEEGQLEESNISGNVFKVACKYLDDYKESIKYICIDESKKETVFIQQSKSNEIITVKCVTK